jgi:putative hydrolase of the HAD superfamily
VIDAVIFDWGGTLTPWKTIDNLAGWRLLAEVLHDGDAERAASLADALLAAEDARWAAAREEHRAFTLEQVLADSRTTTRRTCRPRCASRRSPCTASSGSGRCPPTPMPGRCCARCASAG